MLLTKSDYMIGLQCPRYLWIKIHQPDKIPEPGLVAQHRFDQGHIVGNLAHGLFPSGTVVPTKDFEHNIELTKELIKKRKLIFEGGILAGDLYSRADILKPVGKNEWDVFEVKSSTRVKDEHYLDLAFQKYVYQKYGMKIRKCFLVHINNEYVKKGKINPKEFFQKEEITKEIDTKINDVESNISKILKHLSLKEPPEFQLKDIETSFHENPIIDEFFESLPEGSVFELYGARKKCIELFGQQICMLVDLPEDYKLTGHQEIQRKCAKTGKPHIDKDGIMDFLKKLKYPLYFLDFETFQTAVPLFDGTKPYQQIPFQYSLHVVKSEKSKPKHYSFLAKGPKDQRKEFLSSLKKVLGTEGNIMVFNAAFEKAVLKDLAAAFPKEKKWVESILARIVDLLIPFRNFYYYSPKQKGSASLKNVLPVLTNKSYDKLGINNGEEASIQFLTMTFDEIPEKKIRKDLEEYCGLDTEGMIWIVEKLKRLSK